MQNFSDSLAHLADASRARSLSAIKSLLSYGHRIGYLAFNVGAPVRLPRLKDSIGGALGIFYASGVVAKIEFAEIAL